MEFSQHIREFLILTGIMFLTLCKYFDRIVGIVLIALNLKVTLSK